MVMFVKTVTPHSIENVGKEAGIDLQTFGNPASVEAVKKTVEALKRNGFDAVVVDTAQDALAELKKRIPAGAEVYNGSSTTLGEIGFTDYLKEGKHGWENRHAVVMAEKDWPKQAELRRLATTSEYVLSSAQAITQDGEIVGCDASGSRVGAWLFAAEHLIIVAGTNKIVPDLAAAMTRLNEYTFKLENVRARKVYGMGSNVSKIAILRKEYGPRTTVILVNEALGY